LCCGGDRCTEAVTTALAVVSAPEGAIPLSRARKDLLAIDAVESMFGSMSAR
jgi:hypothetical protein